MGLKFGGALRRHAPEQATSSIMPTSFLKETTIPLGLLVGSKSKLSRKNPLPTTNDLNFSHLTVLADGANPYRFTPLTKYDGT
mmetsp:Transcript_14262/g.29955  ORF Transcript_14262/g.29955 Transcript_14262/m.29955 type:complete len:83 (-) Transcript_14262:2596-2844(-)